ncbi:homeodomain-only protein [Moschus berezovskii]|nr:homeodomain-only protein [Moschus berezovskii]
MRLERPVSQKWPGCLSSSSSRKGKTTTKTGAQRSNRAGTMSTQTASGPTEDQVEILEYNFNKVNKHPDPTTLCLIAAEAGLSEEETQKWFKQRLAQWRRSEGLPSECRSVTD